jgi:DnaJ-class molecular chaperone
MSADPYAALGLKKDATADDIRKAYRKIARQSHPDLNPDDPAAEAKFKQASAAHDLLKDPEKRARFDRGEIDASGAERPQPQQRYYRDFADDPGNPYRGSGARFDDFGDAADIFAEMLRGRRAADASAGFAARGSDMRFTLTVPFLDAARGGEARVTLAEGGPVEVKIPEGAEDGTTLRLRGKGQPGLGGGPPGDALITLSVQTHPVFRREGDDILLTLPITLDEAVLGGKVEVPTIDGPVSLTIPKGVSSGRMLRLRGRGVKGMGRAEKGDQKIELKIVLPPKVDDALAEFMATWKAGQTWNPREGITA